MASNQTDENLPGFVSLPRFLPWAVIAVLWCLILFVAPLGKSILIDADEGSVGMKGMLYQEGYRAFVDFWSDQPPLFYMILCGWFRMFESGLWSGRFLVWIFSGLFLLAFYKSVSDRSTRLGGLLAVLVLFSSAYFLRLSISLMETIPSWALAVSAVALLGSPRNPKTPWCIVVSSVLFALSMTIKFNTALIIQAVLMEVILASGGDERKRRLRNAILLVGSWAGVFLLLALWWRFDIKQLFAVHLGAISQAEFGNEVRGLFQVPHFLLLELPAVILVLSGLITNRNKFVRDNMLPFTWLAVTVVVLFFHAPVWWHHEYLLAMPLAWLAGASIASWCESPGGSGVADLRDFRLQMVILGLFVIIAAPSRMVSTAWILRSPMYAMDERLIRVLKDESATGVKTAAAIRHQGYLVEAGLYSPPELAGSSMKLISTGELDDTYMVEEIKSKRPDLLVFYQTDVDEQLAVAIRGHYIPTKVSEGTYLFKRINQSAAMPDLIGFARHSVSVSPFDREAQIELSRVLASSGYDAEACARYRLALRWSDVFPEWISELATLLATSGDARVKNCDEAIEWMNYGVEKFPARLDVAETRQKILRLCEGVATP